MAADVLSQLLEASWRGIPFPTVMVDTQGGHDLVPHKRVDRDGWLVENTGRNSYVFQVKIPFINTIARGPGETWRDLYPDTYRRVLTALEDRTTGDFVHPDYGLRKCKVADYKTTLDPEFRGGPVVSVTLWETLDEEDGTAVPLEETSAIPIATSAAIDLDAKLGTLNPPPETNLEDDGFLSFSDYVRSLNVVADKAGLLQSKALARIDRVIRTVDNLNAKYAGLITGLPDTANRLISALHHVKQQFAVFDRDKGFFEVKRTTTLADLAKQLRNSVADLMTLNPHLAGQLKIPSFTVVRFYKR